VSLENEETDMTLSTSFAYSFALASAAVIALSAGNAGAQEAPPARVPSAPSAFLASPLARTGPPLAVALDGPPTSVPQRRSTGMMVAGIVLTSLASAAAVAGAVVIAVNARGPGNVAQGIETLFIGVPLLGGSTVLASGGIALWVIGAESPSPTATAGIPAWAVPTVAASPRSASLRWTF
jgi:hypothetical protein